MDILSLGSQKAVFNATVMHCVKLLPHTSTSCDIIFISYQDQIIGSQVIALTPAVKQHGDSNPRLSTPLQWWAGTGLVWSKSWCTATLSRSRNFLLGSYWMSWCVSAAKISVAVPRGKWWALATCTWGSELIYLFILHSLFLLSQHVGE